MDYWLIGLLPAKLRATIPWSGMRQFIEEHEQEVLLILLTMLGVTRWWMPSVWGFENLYGASHWALSYDHGLVRRGLLGTITKLWMPIVTIKGVHLTALVAYCTFLASLAGVFYALMKYKDKHGRLFRLILLFSATPATLSMFARDLGRFDMFLVITLFLCLILLSLHRLRWLIPILMVMAMFIHEAFLVLCAPTLLAAILFVFLWDTRDKKALVTLGVSAISVVSSFFVLYKFGHPSLGYDDFSRLIQSRADFRITDLSMRECYFSVNDHINLTAPYLQDAGSVINFLGAVLILSPVILILLNLWTHALRNCKAHRGVCWLFFLATLSGLSLLPIATDYGRWLSAVIFCNFFAIFFLVSRDVIKVEELAEYSGGSFSLLFVPLLLTYLLFGPLHDWNPYPYQDHVIYSALSITSVLLFDVAFCIRWRSLRRAASSEKD
jgi:hypothetical protein